MGNVSTRQATVNFSRNTLYHVITFKLCSCVQTFEPFAALRIFAFELTFHESKYIKQLGNWILIQPVGTAQKPSLEYGKCSDSILIQATVASIHILFSSLVTNRVFTFCFIQRRSRVNELKRCGKTLPWPTLRHYPGIYMDGLKKTSIHVGQCSRRP
jgi:hypothetical protein